MEWIEAIRSRLKAAHTMVSDLCHGRRDWIMSIPAQKDYDPDLVIGASLSDGDKLMAIAEAALAYQRQRDMGWQKALHEEADLLEACRRFREGEQADAGEAMTRQVEAHAEATRRAHETYTAGGHE